MSRLKEPIVAAELGRFDRVLRDSPDPPGANELVTRAYVDALDAGTEADVTALEARVTTAEGDITALDGRVTTAEGDITTAEGDITTLDGRVTTAEGDITTLDGRVTTAEGDITALDGRVTTAEGDITTAEGNITALDGRVTTAESDIAGLAGRIAIRAIRSASSQAVVSGVPTVVVMNSVSGLGYVRNATAGAGSGDYNLSTGLFTNPGPAQLFLVTATLRCSVGGAGYVRLWIQAPGDLTYDEVNAAGPSVVTVRVSTVALIAASATLSVNLLHNVGSDINLDTNDGFNSLSIFSLADA